MPPSQIRMKRSALWPDSVVSLAHFCRRAFDNNAKTSAVTIAFIF